MDVSATSTGKKTSCTEHCGKLILKATDDGEVALLAAINRCFIDGGRISAAPKKGVKTVADYVGWVNEPD